HQRRKGYSITEARSQIAAYKKFKTHEIETHLKRGFGEEAFAPIGDSDRPFSANELRNLSMNKHVFLGNHTRDHAILTNYTQDEVEEQIRGAQEDIQAMTGKIP